MCCLMSFDNCVLFYGFGVFGVLGCLMVDGLAVGWFLVCWFVSFVFRLLIGF